MSKEVAAEAAAERLLSLRLSLLPILKVERAPGAMEVSSRLYRHWPPRPLLCFGTFSTSCVTNRIQSGRISCGRIGNGTVCPLCESLHAPRGKMR